MPAGMFKADTPSFLQKAGLVGVLLCNASVVAVVVGSSSSRKNAKKEVAPNTIYLLLAFAPARQPAL